MKTCLSCRFYDPEEINGFGRCRKSTPSGFNKWQFQFHEGWPAVKPADWCGEWSGHGHGLETPLASLNLSVRTRNCLDNAHHCWKAPPGTEPLQTVGDVVRFGFSNLRSIRNFGKASMAEVERVLGPIVRGEV